MESSSLTHFINGSMHCISNCLNKWAGDITNTHTNNFIIWMGSNIVVNFVSNRRE